MCFFFFFFNDTATTEIYTLSLHDALPIWDVGDLVAAIGEVDRGRSLGRAGDTGQDDVRLLRSEEHTSELQSRQYLVCRLLLEKKKTMSPGANDIGATYIVTYMHST